MLDHPPVGTGKTKGCSQEKLIKFLKSFKIFQSSYPLPNVSNGEDTKPSCELGHFAC